MTGILGFSIRVIRVDLRPIFLTVKAVATASVLYRGDVKLETASAAYRSLISLANNLSSSCFRSAGSVEAFVMIAVLEIREREIVVAFGALWT